MTPATPRWLLTITMLAGFIGGVCAHQPGISPPIVVPADVPETIRLAGELPPLPEDVTELKFKDIFELPIGPRGLAPTASFLALDGRRVRMVGYMIALTPPTPDAFMFAPLPAKVAAHDEGLADDIPPSTIYVRLPRFSPAVNVSEPGIPQAQGLLQISGTLDVGIYSDAVTGRVFPATLSLDPESRRAFMQLARMARERQLIASAKPAPAVLAGASARD